MVDFLEGDPPEPLVSHRAPKVSQTISVKLAFEIWSGAASKRSVIFSRIWFIFRSIAS